MADAVLVLTLKKEVIMPRGDRTGPFGDGPLTGRRMGFCAGYDHPGYLSQGTGYGRGPGRGLGRGFRGGYDFGRGFGRGYGYGFRPSYPGDIPTEAEKSMIEDEIRILRDQLSSLEDRLSKLGGKESK